MSGNWSQLIQHYRVRNGLTQKQLAQRLSVSQRTISRWERRQDQPSLDHQRVLRDLFHFETSDVVRTLSNTIAFCPAPRALCVMPRLTLVAVSQPAIRKRPSVQNLIGEDLAKRACGVLEEMLDDYALQHGIRTRDVVGVTSVTEGVLKTTESPIAGKFRTTISYFTYDGVLYSDAVSMRARADAASGYWPIYADEIVDGC